MVKAVFLDFYGTVVYEDGVIVKIISERILNTGKAADVPQIAHYWWKVFTSEAARAYKPRTEIFEMALKNTGLIPEEVVHIGDSFSSDVRGAKTAGINAIWLNRNQKTAPELVCEVQDLLQAFKTEYFK